MNIEELNAKIEELQAVVKEKHREHLAAADDLQAFANKAANEISPIKVGDSVRIYHINWIDKARVYKPEAYRVTAVKWSGFGGIEKVDFYGRQILKDGKSLHKNEARLYGNVEKVS